MQKQKFLEKYSKKYLKEFVLKKPSKYYSLTRQDKGEGTARQHSFAPHHHQNDLMRILQHFGKHIHARWHGQKSVTDQVCVPIICF